MAKSNFMDLSKHDYPQQQEGIVTHEEIKIGCLQRIAVAAEAMSKNFVQLQNTNEYLTKRNKELIQKAEKANRSAASYKGKYNHLKNKSNAN